MGCVIKDLKGELNFTGQLKKGYYYGHFVLNPGKYVIKINVVSGKCRLNLNSYNDDGGTFSSPPVKNQNQHQSIPTGILVERSFFIGESHGIADRLEIVNPSMFHPLI